MPKRTKDYYEVTPALLRKVERLASRGLTVIQIGISLGWCEDTIHKKKKENPELAEAIRSGQSKGIETVSNSLFKSANGFSYKEVHEEEKDEDEKKTKTSKVIKKRVLPNIVAQIFYLKNRDPQNWQDKQDHKVSGDITLNIVSEFDAVKNETDEEK